MRHWNEWHFVMFISCCHPVLCSSNRWNDALCIAMLKDKSMPTHIHTSLTHSTHREREGETRAVWTSCNRFIISFVRPANEMCAYFRHEIGTKTSDKIMTNRTKRMKTEPIENGMHSLSHTAQHSTHTNTLPPQRAFVVLSLVINVCHSSFIDLTQVCSFSIFVLSWFFSDCFSIFFHLLTPKCLTQSIHILTKLIVTENRSIH